MSQNVVVRVAHLPLFSTAYNMVTSVYSSTKVNHPYLKSLCEATEKGVMAITAVAVTSAMPILQKLEPQKTKASVLAPLTLSETEGTSDVGILSNKQSAGGITGQAASVGGGREGIVDVDNSDNMVTFANDYACKGLDKMEEKLPFLHHPTNQVIANAKDVVATKVSGAREIFANTISGVVDKTKETVHESVEVTMAIVNSSLNHVLELRVVKMLNSRVNSTLASSETLTDCYLPLTENEQATEAKRIDGFEALAPSYYRRLESLSTKIWQQAYERATIAILRAKQESQEVLAQLRYNLDLIQYVRKNMSTTNQMINDAWDKLYRKLVEWKTSNLGCEGCESDMAEQIESPTMAILQNPSQQMQIGHVMLVSSVWGLPQNIQDQVQCITVSAMEMYMMSTTSFKELPDQIFSTSKDQLAKMKDLLDGLVDYLVNNTPLNWLVGPFYPQLTGSQHPDQEVKTDITEEEQSEQMHSCGD